MKILDVIKETLIGKSLNIKVKHEPIIEFYDDIVKKSNSVTNKQFESGDPKYTMVAHRRRITGYDTVYQHKKIIDIIDTGGDDYGGYIIVKFEDNTTYNIDLMDDIELF